MTTKADFTDEEWETVVEGPTSAGLIVAAAQKGGVFRESMAIAKAFTEARGEHGESELLDALAHSRPKMDRGGARSPEELKQAALEHIREAVGLVEQKAPDEIDSYKRFILSLSQQVAEAKKGVSNEEQLAIADIAQVLGLPSPA